VRVFREMQFCFQRELVVAKTPQPQLLHFRSADPSLNSAILARKRLLILRFLRVGPAVKLVRFVRSI
jgi:hypothetical protein